MYNTTNNQLSNKNEGLVVQLESEQAQSAQNEQKIRAVWWKNWNEIAVNNPLNKCVVTHDMFLAIDSLVVEEN